MYILPPSWCHHLISDLSFTVTLQPSFLPTTVSSSNQFLHTAARDTFFQVPLWLCLPPTEELSQASHYQDCWMLSPNLPAMRSEPGEPGMSSVLPAQQNSALTVSWWYIFSCVLCTVPLALCSSQHLTPCWESLPCWTRRSVLCFLFEAFWSVSSLSLSMAPLKSHFLPGSLRSLIIFTLHSRCFSMFDSPCWHGKLQKCHTI